VLGTASPRAELSDLVEQIEHALSIKLGTLSQSAIARIIREHDREHRLDGFLKITQAAQTDALTRVLDERLARYLAQLLDEGLGGAAPHEPRGSLRRIDRDLKGPRLRSAPKPGAHN
jgi:Arc/MetJ family transcription regulator